MWDRKYNTKLLGGDKDREKLLTSYCRGQNRLSLGKSNLLPVKSEENDEK